MAGNAVVHQLTEREVKSIASDAVKEETREIVKTFNDRFDKIEVGLKDFKHDIETMLEKREERLVKDIQESMKPIAGRFKDEAIKESAEAMKAHLRYYGLEDTQESINYFRRAIEYAGGKAIENAKIGSIIKKSLWTGAVSFILSLVFLGLFKLIPVDSALKSDIGKFLFEHLAK
jgi:dGTP triphosphohydrolase